MVLCFLGGLEALSMCLVFSGSGGKPQNTDGQSRETQSLGQVAQGL